MRTRSVRLTEEQISLLIRLTMNARDDMNDVHAKGGNAKAVTNALHEYAGKLEQIRAALEPPVILRPR